MLELKTIAATLKNEDVDVLFTDYVEDFFLVYGETWNFIKDYYKNYGVMPSIEAVGERYPDVLGVEAHSHPDDYMSQLRDEFISEAVNRIMVKGTKFNQTESGIKALAEVQNQLAKYNRYTAKAKITNVMDFEEADRHYEEVRERVEAHGGVPGIPTGVNFFDASYPTGLQPGDLVVVLGYTGRMKSFFTTLVACNAYASGYTPMIASVEMDAAKIRDRVWTTMGKGMFRNSSLAMGDIGVDSFQQFRKQYEKANGLWIVESDGAAPLTPNSMQVKFNQHRPDIMVWDYAQLMMDNGHSENMTQRMMNLSNEAKAFAQANEIPVVMISSATGDGTKVTDIAPDVEQVAWSKQLAFNADLSVAVHKHNDSDIVDVVCRKNRNGPLFAGSLNWDVDQGIIKELDL